MLRMLVRFLLVVLCLCSGFAYADEQPKSPDWCYQEKWAYDCDDRVDEISSADGKVFFAGTEAIGAVDITSGKLLWKKSIEDKGFGAKLDYSGGVLYASVGEWKLLACDPKTGKVRWSIKRKGYSAPIRVYGETLFGEVQNGTLVALSLKSRRAKWTIKIDNLAVATKQSRDAGLAAKPILIGKRLYIATNAGEVMCLNPTSGSVIWRYKIPALPAESGISASGIAIDANRVYATHDGGIVALDISTGKKLWSFNSRGQVEKAPAIFGQLIVFVSADGYLYALRSEDGNQVWKAELCKAGIRMSSAPVVDSNSILVSIDNTLFAFDSTGNQLWVNSIPDLGGDNIQSTKYGLLMAGGPWVGLVTKGKSDIVPSDPAARADLANKLISRIEKLTRSEKRILSLLGDEGFAAVLPLVHQRMSAYEKASADAESEDGSYTQYRQLEESLNLLIFLATTRQTARVLELMQTTATGAPLGDLMRWLTDNGDEQILVPFAISIMQKSIEYAEEDLMSDRQYNLAIGILAQSSDPRAVAFLIQKLCDLKADPCLRWIAFYNLPRSGSPDAVAAVTAAKDTIRTILPIEQAIELSSLPFSLETTDSELKLTDDHPWLELSDIQTDKYGTKWGLIGCRAAGSRRGLWIAKYENEKWSNLLYTGIDDNDKKVKNWLAFTIDENLVKDSDGDGWTDILEASFGLNPNNADTDGDGLIDPQDKNPLAAPRSLDDTEQVLAATFEARFRFEGDYTSITVYLPNNMKPFELMGREWVTLCANIKDEPKSTGRRGERPNPSVTFRSPECDFDSAKVYESDKNKVVLWNADKTQAKTHIVAYYGPLSATGYDVRLAKINGVWFVVEMQMMWIS